MYFPDWYFESSNYIFTIKKMEKIPHKYRNHTADRGLITGLRQANVRRRYF